MCRSPSPIRASDVERPLRLFGARVGRVGPCTSRHPSRHPTRRRDRPPDRVLLVAPRRYRRFADTANLSQVALLTMALLNMALLPMGLLTKAALHYRDAPR